MPDTSQGNDPPNGSQGGGEPEFVTKEDFNKALNAAITKRFNEFSTAFEKKTEGLIAKQFETVAPTLEKLLDDKLSTLKPAEGGKGPTGTDPTKVDIENHPVVKGMKKQLEEQGRASQALKEERDAERAKARDGELRRRVGEHLSKAIPADRLPHAVGFLIDAQKRVKWNDDFTDIVFRDRDGDVDLETGLSTWQKSDDAKIYLPPRGPQGSGERGGGRNPRQQNGKAQAVTFGQVGEAVLNAIPTVSMPAPR